MSLLNIAPKWSPMVSNRRMQLFETWLEHVIDFIEQMNKTTGHHCVCLFVWIPDGLLCKSMSTKWYDSVTYKAMKIMIMRRPRSGRLGSRVGWRAGGRDGGWVAVQGYRQIANIQGLQLCVQCAARLVQALGFCIRSAYEHRRIGQSQK